MRVTDEESAKVALKDINSDARRLMADFGALQQKLTLLERFFRNDSQRYKVFHNAHSVRVAGSELLRMARKLPQALMLLKQLEGFSFPILLKDEEKKLAEEEEKKKELIKINKNVAVPRIIKTTEPEDELTPDE